mgnify:FL=1
MPTRRSGLPEPLRHPLWYMQNIQPQGVPAVPYKYYLYARKSSEAEDRQVASIDAQVAELQKVAWENNLNVIEILTESQSAKAPGRPVFNQMLERIKSGKAEGIICWKLDRLARNPIDGGQISWMLQKNIIKQIQTFGRVYYPTDNVLMMQVELGMANQFIIDLSVNVKRGLRAKCEQGWRPCPPPFGYLHDTTAKKGHKIVLLDPIRAPILKQIFEKVAYQGESGRRIARWLEEIDIKTRNGKKVYVSTIYKILRETFYYGEFEYPVGSGKRYKGAHDPIIDKYLFDKVQSSLVYIPKLRPGTKEFNFVKMFKCGVCKSSITATEKFKKLARGGINRYVYNHCTRFHDMYCKQPYLREENLIDQLADLIDHVSIDKLGAKDKLQRELARQRYFTKEILGKEATDAEIDQVNIKGYAKYILREGNREEKREILCNLKSEISLKDGKIEIKS